MCIKKLFAISYVKTRLDLKFALLINLQEGVLPFYYDGVFLP